MIGRVAKSLSHRNHVGARNTAKLLIELTCDDKARMTDVEGGCWKAVGF